VLAKRFSYVCAGILGLAYLIVWPSSAKAAWPTDPLANLRVCGVQGTQHAPVITTDGAGGAIIAWQDGRSGGTAYHIYAQHVLASGVIDPVWPQDGKALCLAFGGGPGGAPRVRLLDGAAVLSAPTFSNVDAEKKSGMSSISPV